MGINPKMFKIVLATAFVAIGQSIAFQVQSPLFVNSLCKRQHHTVLFGDKEKEIAELEEQLAQLKADSSVDVEASTDSSTEKKGGVTLPPEITEPVDEFDMNAYRKRVANVKEQPPAEFLTEAWKESEDSEMGGVIKNLALGIGAIVFLVAFSQVPIGDEGLMRYSEKIGL